MRRFFAWFLVLLLWAGSASAEGERLPPDIQARGAVLIERTSGRILYQKNANERLPMASTTKIMTALLAIESCSLDETVVASKNASGVTGTSIYLRVGEQLTMRNMLYGLMLKSGNDAAVAIAEHIDGDVEQFARRMNLRALQLGADAQFVTPNGLDATGHSASALGMAKIAAEALNYPVFREIVSTQSATIPWPGNEYDRVLENKNKLLKTLPGATGVKTGFTSKAGRCLVFSCERDGMELVGAVLHCGTWFDSATELIEWGFAEYEPQNMFEKGDVALEPSVTGGLRRSLDAVYAQTLTLPVTQSESPMVLLEMMPIEAPILRGQVVGRALVTVDGKTVSEVNLVSAHDVEKAGFWSALKKSFQHWGITSRS